MFCVCVYVCCFIGLGLLNGFAFCGGATKIFVGCSLVIVVGNGILFLFSVGGFCRLFLIFIVILVFFGICFLMYIKFFFVFILYTYVFCIVRVLSFIRFVIFFFLKICFGFWYCLMFLCV